MFKNETFKLQLFISQCREKCKESEEPDLPELRSLITL